MRESLLTLRSPEVFKAEKGAAADVTGAPQPKGLLCSPVMKMMIIITFCPFPSSGVLVE
jgi:hypothetical protein